MNENETKADTEPPATFQPAKLPIEPITREQAQSLLHAYAKLAEKYPDKPALLLELSKAQSVEAIKASMFMAMPETWHHPMKAYFELAEDDELRLLACLFAVIFVQGMMAGMMVQQKAK